MEQVADNCPTISILVAVRPGNHAEVLSALPALAYPAERVEVLVAEGFWPPGQHNAAVRQARGDILYFLDDDSLPCPDLLKRTAAHYLNPAVAVVGGPSLTVPDAPLFQRCVGHVLGTWTGAWTMRARYRSVGRVRCASERELITCNLSLRRDVFISAGGFSPHLFPNDETDLLARLGSDHHLLVYDPNIVVRRPQRSNAFTLARQFFSYGQGRMKQMRLTPRWIHGIYLLPLLWSLVLTSWPFVMHPWMMWLLAGYGGLLFATTMALAVREREVGALLLGPIILAGVHLAYSLGLGAELVWPRSTAARQKAPVQVRWFKRFGEEWDTAAEQETNTEQESTLDTRQQARPDRKKWPAQAEPGSVAAWPR